MPALHTGVMHVRLLHLDDCPNWRVLRERLADESPSVGLSGRLHPTLAP